jgi:dephospho-CoA kinase
VVFADPQALLDLRAITDYYVSSEIDRLLSDHAAAGGRVAAVDAINILDTKLMDYGIVTVGVTAPEELRVQRLMAREGISEEYAKKRIAAQHEEAWFREKCDYVLENDGTLDAFRAKCLAFLRHVCIMDT